MTLKPRYATEHQKRKREKDDQDVQVARPYRLPVCNGLCAHEP